MPVTTAFIDQMREAFGVEIIDAAIRGGLRGDGSFFARENGHEVGSRPVEVPGRSVNGFDLAKPLPEKYRK